MLSCISACVEFVISMLHLQHKIGLKKAEQPDTSSNNGRVTVTQSNSELLFVYCDSSTADRGLNIAGEIIEL